MNDRLSRSYHHGDLRNALIIAAAELIEELGSLNFTMADAARRAGVSNAAPYRHFRDRDALLEAVTQLGFYALGESSRRIAQSHPRGSLEGIIALGRNYVTFVQQKAAFYDLMWGDIGTRSMDDENFNKTASGFYVLSDSVEAYLENRSIRGVDKLDIAVKLWALVHGLAAVSMSGKLAHFHPEADVPAMLDSATRQFFTGLTQDLVPADAERGPQLSKR